MIHMKDNSLVVKSSKDTGQIIVRELAFEGYSLILHYHKNINKIKHLINDLNKDVVLGVYQADLTSKAEIQRMLDNIIYPVESIIFVSGLADSNLFQETSEEMMDSMLSLRSA